MDDDGFLNYINARTKSIENYKSEILISIEQTPLPRLKEFYKMELRRSDYDLMFIHDFLETYKSYAQISRQNETR